MKNSYNALDHWNFDMKVFKISALSDFEQKPF